MLISQHLNVVQAHSSHLRLLLLLILNQLDIILWHLLILVHQELHDVLAQIALYSNLLAAARNLSHARPCGELFAKVLCDLLDVEAKRFEALHGGDVFALVALDALNEDLGRGELFGAASFCGRGFCGFLLRVFFCALLCVDGEGREVLGYGFYRDY